MFKVLQEYCPAASLRSESYLCQEGLDLDCKFWVGGRRVGAAVHIPAKIESCATDHYWNLASLQDGHFCLGGPSRILCQSLADMCREFSSLIPQQEEAL